MRTALVAIVVMLVPAASARADAVDIPPHDCPSGATGTTSHAGQWCRPADCSASVDCEHVMDIVAWSTPGHPDPGRYQCASSGLCVRTSEIPRGGDSMPGDTTTKTEAMSTCGSDADCLPGVSCIVAPHCTEDPSWVSPSSPRSGSFWRRAFYCDGPSGPPTRVGGLFLGFGGLGLAAVLARRRRR